MNWLVKLGSKKEQPLAKLPHVEHIAREAETPLGEIMCHAFANPDSASPIAGVMVQVGGGEIPFFSVDLIGRAVENGPKDNVFLNDHERYPKRTTQLLEKHFSNALPTLLESNYLKHAKYLLGDINPYAHRIYHGDVEFFPSNNPLNVIPKRQEAAAKLKALFKTLEEKPILSDDPQVRKALVDTIGDKLMILKAVGIDPENASLNGHSSSGKLTNNRRK